MRVAHLYLVSRWHSGHRHLKPVECACWNLCVLVWLAGWVGVGLDVLYHRTWLAPVFLAAIGVPDLYSRCRLRLARASTIRCDWADTLPYVQRPRARSPRVPVGRRLALWCRSNACVVLRAALAISVLLALFMQTTLLDGALSTPLLELEWRG